MTPEIRTKSLSVDFPTLLADYPNFRPTAGRCLICMERKPALAVDSDVKIIAPEIARDVVERDIAYFGTVLKMTPRRDFIEDFAEGDRVWIMLLQEDLQEEYILTLNTRVYARQKREGEK